MEFAPLNTPLVRRLQVAAVLQWVMSFILIVQVSTGISVMLIVYNYWYIYIPYLIWLYFDWQTPEQGGRRSNWVKSWTVWRHFKDYFPLHCNYQQICAVENSASLVPVFSFGENELFKQINNPEGSWLRFAQETLKKSTGFTLPLCYARGIFQYNFGLVPYRKPIYTVVGRPIPVRRTPHPTQEQTDQLHQTYMEELKKLFDEHKGKYGIPEHETLVFKNPMDVAATLSALRIAPVIHLSNKMFCAPPKMDRSRIKRKERKGNGERGQMNRKRPLLSGSAVKDDEGEDEEKDR
ncbi:hypothetical protein ACRRTK_000135 [Alexandromys fortis]